MVRKWLMNAVKRTAQTALLASALYATTQTSYAAPGGNPFLRPSQPSTNTQTQTSPGLLPQLPAPLTQQTPDFYKNPEKEFEFYRQAYTSVAKDGIIDREDVRTLEHVLGATLKEINSKILNQHGMLKDALPASDEVKSYLNFAGSARNQYALLRKHLENYEQWQAIVAKSKQFIHDGYAHSIWTPSSELLRGQAQELTESMKNSPLTPMGLYDPKTRTMIYPKVLRPFDELQIQPKMNWRLGLALGVTIPGLMTYAGYARRRKYGKNGNELVETFSILHAICSPILGLILFDALSPMVYPLRVGLPVVCEAGMQAYDALNARRNRENQAALGQQTRTQTPQSSSPPSASLSLEQRAQAEQAEQTPPASEQPQKSPTIYSYIPIEPYTPEEATAHKAELNKQAAEEKRQFFFRNVK